MDLGEVIALKDYYILLSIGKKFQLNNFQIFFHYSLFLGKEGFFKDWIKTLKKVFWRKEEKVKEGGWIGNWRFRGGLNFLRDWNLLLKVSKGKKPIYWEFSLTFF